MKVDDYSYCQVIGVTDRGLKRAANEDWLGEKKTPNGWVAVVCDGMGGHVGGATASHIAVETILDYLSAEYFDDPRIAIGKAIDEANAAILRRVSQQPELDGMGSTCVLLIVREGKVYIGHVGDSRIYLVRDHRIHQLTKDHSYVQMLVDMGEITPEQAEHHPRKNEITNALGLRQMQPATVMQNPIEPQAGDCFLLCSDGLSGMVDAKTIEHVVSRQKELSAQERAETLIRKAKEGGGLDNITAQLVEFGATPSISKVHKNISHGWWIGSIILTILCIIAVLFYFLRPQSEQDDNAAGAYIQQIQKESKEFPINRKLIARNDTVMLLAINGTSDTCSVVLMDANREYLGTLDNVIWRTPRYQPNKIVVNYDAMPVNGIINGVVRLMNVSERAFVIYFESKDEIYQVEVDVDVPLPTHKPATVRREKEAATEGTATDKIPTNGVKDKEQNEDPQPQEPKHEESKKDTVNVPADSITQRPEENPVDTTAQ